MAEVKSVLQWVGGKYYTRHEIISRFPSHDSYVEVFGGAGHVLFAKEPAPKAEIFNDIDRNIYTFFKVLQDNPDELLYLIYTTPYSRDFFNDILNMKPKNDKEY